MAFAALFVFFPGTSFAQSADGSVPAPTAAAPTRADSFAPTGATTKYDPASNTYTYTLPPVNSVIEMAAPAAVQAAPQPWRPMLVGAFAGILSLFGIQTGVKKMKNKGSTQCSCCKGTGRESSCDTCSTCNGTKVVDDTQDLSGPCLPCGGSGEETCTSCEGKVELEGNASCAACALTGKNREENGEPVECGLCGEGELSGTVKRQVPCPKCQ